MVLFDIHLPMDSHSLRRQEMRYYKQVDENGQLLTCDQDYMYRDFPAEIKRLGLNGYAKEVKISMGEITGINTSRGTDALVLITDGRATTGFNKWGVDVIINSKGIITQIVDGKANTPIPKGCICLSGHNNAGWYLKQHCKVGARLKIGE